MPNLLNCFMYRPSISVNLQKLQAQEERQGLINLLQVMVQNQKWTSNSNLSMKYRLLPVNSGGSVIPIPNRYRDIFKYRYRRRYYKFRKIPNTDKKYRIVGFPTSAYFHDTVNTLTVIFLLWSLFSKYLYRRVRRTHFTQA